MFKELLSITDEEAEHVRILIEKQNALRNLKIVLENLNSNKKDTLLKKCEQEYNAVSCQYQNWWLEIADKYNLDTDEKELFVDTTARTICFN